LKQNIFTSKRQKNKFLKCFHFRQMNIHINLLKQNIFTSKRQFFKCFLFRQDLSSVRGPSDPHRTRIRESGDNTKLGRFVVETIFFTLRKRASLGRALQSSNQSFI
jgi:hypothetical protein